MRLVVGFANTLSARATTSQLRLNFGEAVVGVLQEDKAHDRRGVLAGLQVRVRAKLIGRLPEATGDVVDVGGASAGFSAHSAILTLQG